MMILPAARDLQYFVEAAQAGNLTRAAERLGIRQSSMSQAIARLEKSLGLPLLLREKTGVRLTRAGQSFFPRARGLLAEWASLRGEVLGNDTAVKGRFTLGC